jgi:hypothetical protein
MHHYCLWVLSSYISGSCCEKCNFGGVGRVIPIYGVTCKFEDFFQLHTLKFISPFSSRIHNVTLVSGRKNLADVDLFPVELFICEILSPQGKINEFEIPVIRNSSA